MIILGILLMFAAMAWLWRWLVRHEGDVRLRWAGLAAHPRVTALRTRFAPQIAFLQARLSPAEFLGLDLTLGAVILIGAVWIFGGIAEDVVTGDPLTVVDREIAVWLHLHATPTLTDAMKFISLLASWPVVMTICLFMAIYFVRKHSHYRLLALTLTIPVGMLLNGMLKLAFHRSRPAWDDPILMIETFSFPSGHAMAATLLYGFLAAFGVRKARAWRWRVLAVLAAGMLVVLIGFSRLYLGVHYLSDVLAGMAAGSAWLALCLTVVGTLRRHRAMIR
ncbi:MAG: phosphatase PAP2 family protein [bacterium]|jgi:undecaprenyl-diphosphatase